MTHTWQSVPVCDLIAEEQMNADFVVNPQSLEGAQFLELLTGWESQVHFNHTEMVAFAEKAHLRGLAVSIQCLRWIRV
jgi:hypothetical protein